MTPPRAALLFDIDGTLIRPHGAGRRAFQHALDDCFSLRPDDEGFDFGGRTDRDILRGLLARAGAEYPAPEVEARFVEAYIFRLREELARGRATICPGVPELLEALASDGRFHLGLVTGNFVRGAETKLKHLGLWEPFTFGAYGDDHEDRNRLVPIALERLRALGAELHPARSVVIGDTPRDHACARAAGAPVVLVQTGLTPGEVLEELEPNAYFADLSDTGRVIQTFARLTGVAS